MPKRICGSTGKPSDDHSKKTCACGGHSHGHKHAKPKGKKPDRTTP